MVIDKLVMGYAQTNTYFIKKDDKVVVVDPCNDPYGDSTRLINQIEGYHVVGIILTHGHFDHISGVDAIIGFQNCPVYVPESEIDWLVNPELNLSEMIPELVSVKSKAIGIGVGRLVIEPFCFEVIKTPGHTRGSLTYIMDDHVFDGDFIMKRSMGRTDLPTGNAQEMAKSIQEFVTKYKEKDFILYPGHGDITTLKDEILHNPFIISLLGS
jgi:hydroxyacylglutathione hydrolase